MYLCNRNKDKNKNNRIMKHRFTNETEKEITCPSGKVGYKSKNKAENAIRSIQINSSRSGRFRAYYCKECGEYHLTSCHITGPNMLKKSFCQYDRREKKMQDMMIFQAVGIA